MTSEDTKKTKRLREGEAPAELRCEEAQRELRTPEELRTPDECEEAQRELRTPDELRTPEELRTPDERTGFRKHPAHGVYISPVNPTIVYVTVCCDKRKPWLASDGHHQLLLGIWQDTSHWVVGRYVLMPDHLHLFAAPQEKAVAFDAWVKYWKSQFTKRNKDPKCVWQTDHWDTRIRSQKHYEEKSNYMFDNPARAGLVIDPLGWPYKGVVHDLR